MFVIVVFLYFNLFKKPQTRNKVQDHPNKQQKNLKAKHDLRQWLDERVNTAPLTGQTESTASVIITSAWAMIVALLVLWRTGDGV